ncbi:hypothetical protein GXB81_24885 [Paraburkholderia sp. Ac-20336]|uniref:hypothetical protein n=1 Tax=unclassified Paraburkholderia TaxID=2615204 RepID=UPI00197E8640|nr:MULTISPECIES: hypothetical protein [unclassified Paraburkholderia]MBN3806267.1 hypothetical protein [Paraburkholderia sp. Ac-20336]MBN3850899.1 hypothetical protein [Paraburkholderia sp. Ac-20342]
MPNPPPKRSFVVSFDEEQDKLTVCSLNDADLAPFLNRALRADWPLADVNHELTDDVARRLGAAALTVLSVYHPALKPMLKVKIESPPTE